LLSILRNILCQYFGGAAKIAEEKKYRRYNFLRNRLNFVPLALETSRVWGKDDFQLIEKIGSRITEVIGEKRATSFLFQRLSICFKRGNAASILGTLPPGKELSEVFYL
jgi:hypothetical protein